MWALDWLVCMSKLCSPGESFTMSRKGQVLQYLHVSRIQKIRQYSHYRLRIKEAM